jgi:hypothetical protein
MGAAVAARRFLDRPSGPSQHHVGVILSRSFSDFALTPQFREIQQ